MISLAQGHVSLLVHFRPNQVRAAVARLKTFLDTIDGVVTRLDESGGHIELAGVRGLDVGHLREWLFQRGARCVFVRYEHEGPRPWLAHDTDEPRDERPN